MTKNNNIGKLIERMLDLPVFGLMISLVLFVTGYFVSGQDLQTGIRGYEADSLSTGMPFGKYMYISSGIFLLISVVGYIKASIGKNKNSFIEGGRSLSVLEELSWKEFVVYIMVLYKKLGYRLEGESGVRAAGVDLKMKRDGSLALVRCKKYYVRKVSLSMLQEFYDAMKKEPALKKGYFITTGFFSHDARKFASGKPIELVDGARLMDFTRIAESIAASQEISSLQNNLKRFDYTCPLCGASMMLRTGETADASGTQFWGCTAPACKGSLRNEREEAENFG
jgi:restriction system protein